VTKFSLAQVPLLNTEYEGIHAIEFEKARAAWYVGYLEEAREIMYKVYNHNSLVYSQAAFRNLRSIGYPRSLNEYNPQKFKMRTVKKNYSQIYQDLFVLKQLNEKSNGTYLEIGCADPIICNNTFLLENLGWSGISIDIAYHHIAKFKLLRKNTAICADATQIDYNNLGLPEVIDYLQVDCEPPEVSFNILEKVISTGKIFNTITFEHDSYLAGDEIKNKSRELLSKDYVLVVPDVRFDSTGIFEDWWAHKSIAEKSYSSMEEYFDMVR